MLDRQRGEADAKGLVRESQSSARGGRKLHRLLRFKICDWHYQGFWGWAQSFPGEATWLLDSQDCFLLVSSSWSFFSLWPWALSCNTQPCGVGLWLSGFREAGHICSTWLGDVWYWIFNYFMQMRLIMKLLQQLEYCMRKVVPEYDTQQGLGSWTRAQTRTLQNCWVGPDKISAGDPRVWSGGNLTRVCQWRKSVTQPSPQPQGLRQEKQCRIQEKVSKASVVWAQGESLSSCACCGSNSNQLHLVLERRCNNCSGFIPPGIWMCQRMLVLMTAMSAL